MNEVSLYNQSQALRTTQPKTIEEIIEAFIQSSDVKESSRNQYRRSIKPFFVWVNAKNYDMNVMDRISILEFKEDLLKRGISSYTVNGYLTAVRKFYDFVETIKMYQNIAKGVKGAKSKKQFRKLPLSEIQGKSLVKHIQEDASLRDFAIINLLIRTGLRTIEVTRLNVEDITFKGDKRVLLIQGKGRDDKDNFVVLTDKSYDPIEKYLATRKGVKAGEPLFSCTSNRNLNGRLTTRSISRMAKDNLKDIGLNSREFTAHSLRHTTAVNILRAGGGIAKAQDVLRHSSPATTQIYTASINEEMRLKDSGESLLDNAY